MTHLFCVWCRNPPWACACTEESRAKAEAELRDREAEREAERREREAKFCCERWNHHECDRPKGHKGPHRARTYSCNGEALIVWKQGDENNG